MVKRKSLVVGLVLLLLFSVSACGSGGSKESAAEPTVSERAAALYTEHVAGEDAVLAQLDVPWAYDFAEKISSFGSADDGRGFHLVGTDAGKEAVDYAYDTFKELGFNPEYDEFDGVIGWTYRSSDIKVSGHDDLDIFITSAPYTPGTPAGGVTGPLVSVGTATKEELDGVDLTGKIAVAEFDWDYMLWMNDVAFQCQQHGASGVIYYMTNGYGNDETGDAEFVGDWSGAESKIPVWAVDINDGRILDALAQAETPEVTVTSIVEINRNAKGYNVLASIAGAKYPDEYIVINAHPDAYFHAFQDDSVGMGIMMAMAKAMIEADYQPDHTIVFVVADGEESGKLNTYYDWLLGSWHLVQEKAAEWQNAIVDAHTLEMVGDSLSTNFGFRAENPTYLFTQAVADGLNQEKVLKNFAEVDLYQTTSSDEWAFAYYGYPTTRTIYENKADEVYQASIDDTGRRFSYERFADYIYAHTTLILRADKQAAAPYDLNRGVQQYTEDLRPELLAANGVDPQALTDTLGAYAEKSAALLDKTLQIEAAYRQAQADGQDLSAADTLLKSFNGQMRAALGTALRGVNYVALDIPVAPTIYYQYIPGVYTQAVANLQAGDGAKMLEEFDVDNEEQEQFPTYYSTTHEYATWLGTYGSALNPDSATYDFAWTKDRLLKYYDFYPIRDAVQAKVEAGDTDFSAEITALEAIAADVTSRLQAAYAGDLAMWQTAAEQLPLDTADQILEALQ